MVFPTVNRVEQFITGAILFWLVMCHIISAGVMGILYAIVFACTKAIRCRLPFFFSGTRETTTYLDAFSTGPIKNGIPSHLVTN
jgi:hypothetical protein